MTMLPEPEITFEIRRPLADLRIAFRHGWREVRETWDLIRAAYRNRQASQAESEMWARAALDGSAEVGGETVQMEVFLWKAPVWSISETGKRTRRREPRAGAALVQKRHPWFYEVRA
jgi:hypothetical protein